MRSLTSPFFAGAAGGLAREGWEGADADRSSPHDAPAGLV
jgi:hypothetical protein